MESARRYPALRIAICAGVAAVASGREGLLYRLLVETKAPKYPSDTERSLTELPFPPRVIDEQVASRLQFADMTGLARWPASHYLRVSCRSAMQELTDEREYAAAFDRYEFLRGMLELTDGRVTRASFREFATRSGTRPTIPVVDEITDGWPLTAAGAFGGQAATAREVHEQLITQISELPFF